MTDTNYWPRVILVATIAAAIVLVVLPDKADAYPCDEETTRENPEECATVTPAPEPTPTPIVEPTATPLPTPEATPTATPTPADPTPTPTFEPTPTAEPTPTSTPDEQTSSPTPKLRPPARELAYTGGNTSTLAWGGLAFIVMGLISTIGARKAGPTDDS